LNQWFLKGVDLDLMPSRSADSKRLFDENVLIGNGHYKRVRPSRNTDVDSDPCALSRTDIGVRPDETMRLWNQSPLRIEC
jgi:hypothetical protein